MSQNEVEAADEFNEFDQYESCCKLSMDVKPTVRFIPTLPRTAYEVPSLKVAAAEGDRSSEVLISVLPVDFVVDAPLNICCVVDTSGKINNSRIFPYL